MKIYDNFLDKDIFKNIQTQFFSEEFPWYYQTSVIDGEIQQDCRNYQFTHMIYQREVLSVRAYQIIFPIIEKINPLCLLRVKANMNTYSGNSILEHGMHKDIERPDLKIYTAVFYINSNNGYTKLNDTKVLSKENTLVEFDSNTYHSGSTSTNSKNRIVLNLNYIK